MTDQEMNAAIAKACGTLKEGTHPQYTSDLNAMAEATATLTDDQRLSMVNTLYDVVPRGWMMYHADFDAKASQRAEAFLRTLGLFTE